MNGKGKMVLKVGQKTVRISYQYENLSEKTSEAYNKMVASRRK